MSTLKNHHNEIVLLSTQITCKKVSEYDQEIQQSQTADQPTAL